jgi:hypothetical protein
MKRLPNVIASCRPYGHRALWLASAAAVWVATSPLAFAAKKKALEVVPETKSYVTPYLIVLMLIGLGMMAVLRPGKRADRPDEKMKTDNE